MKWLLILMFLVGCSGKRSIQENIDEFTNQCKKLSECMEMPYEVQVDITSNSYPLFCSLSVNKFQNGVYYPENELDLEDRPTFGYDFLKSAITTCEILKSKGLYTKEQLNRRYRFRKCVDLDPENSEHKSACFKQYQNDDGTLEEECDINCKLEKISKIKKD